jgi:activator of HSP90 ATPase
LSHPLADYHNPHQPKQLCRLKILPHETTIFSISQTRAKIRLIDPEGKATRLAPRHFNGLYTRNSHSSSSSRPSTSSRSTSTSLLSTSSHSTSSSSSSHISSHSTISSNHSSTSSHSISRHRSRPHNITIRTI